MPRKDSGLLSQERSAITDFPVWSTSVAVVAVLGCRSATHATIQKLHGHATRKCSVHLPATVMILRWFETPVNGFLHVASPRVGAIGIAADLQRHRRRLRHPRHLRHLRQVYLPPSQYTALCGDGLHLLLLQQLHLLEYSAYRSPSCNRVPIAIRDPRGYPDSSR